MKEILQPPFLSKGDKAVIISPSGNIDVQYIEGMKLTIEEWELQAEVSPYAGGQYGRFSGTVAERLYDLQCAMDDTSAKLIFCSRGGYGAVHLLESLDFTAILKQPKWLVGYSDITALHLAFLANGLASLHAPMARHLTEGSENTASVYLKEALFKGIKRYGIPAHPLNRTGKAKGFLFGGNLSVLSGLIGTPYMKVYRKGILFIEDIGECPYKIDRMITHLKLSGILQSISGLIVGQFSDCEEDPSMNASVYESIRNVVDKYNYPVIFNFPVGHVDDNYPMIQGGNVVIEVENNSVTLEYEK